MLNLPAILWHGAFERDGDFALAFRQGEGLFTSIGPTYPEGSGLFGEAEHLCGGILGPVAATGLEGANGLDGSMLHGSVLLNLDSEEDGRLTVRCTGSTDTWIRVQRPRRPSMHGVISTPRWRDARGCSNRPQSRLA